MGRTKPTTPTPEPTPEELEAIKKEEKRKRLNETNSARHYRKTYIKRNIKDDEFSELLHGELRDILYSISKCSVATAKRMIKNKILTNSLSIMEISILRAYIAATDGNRFRLGFILDLLKYFLNEQSKRGAKEYERTPMERPGDVNLNKLSDELISRISEEISVIDKASIEKEFGEIPDFEK